MYNVQTYVDTINNQLLVESYGVMILNMIAIQTPVKVSVFKDIHMVWLILDTSDVTEIFPNEKLRTNCYVIVYDDME